MLTKWEKRTTQSALSKYEKTIETKTKEPLRTTIRENIKNVRHKLKLSN
jgi:hypothetical protein